MSNTAKTTIEKTPEQDRDVEWADNVDQDDINDILGFDLGSADGEDRTGLRALINSSIVAGRRLPMLDVICDRAARQMTTSLRQISNDNVDVALDDISTVRFGEFIQSLPTPSVIAILNSPESDSHALLAVDAGFVYSFVDLLLGGRRSGATLSFEERSFSQIELGLVSKILSILANDISKAFHPVAEYTFTVSRIETTPRFAAIAQVASVCSHAKFRVDLEERNGRCAFLAPHAALEPVRERLQREFYDEATLPESLWGDALSAELRNASVDLRAVIAEKEISVSGLEALSIGDTIEFSSDNYAQVEVRAGELVLATGDVGRSGNSIALRLQNIISGIAVNSPEHDAQMAINKSESV